MNILSTKTHGVIDYAMGILLILSPWLFDLGLDSAAGLVPFCLGIGAIVYSLFTDYELGAVKGISMRTHLWLDELSGVFLAASPWIFNFDEMVYMPHLVLGIAEFAVAVMTRVRAPIVHHRSQIQHH
jgi:hypothetical protein